MSKTIYIQGNLTNSFKQMLADCCQVTHPLFGSMKRLIPKLGNPLTKEQISNLHDSGTNKEFYMREEYDVWGYICIKPEKYYSNYVFAIGDHENKENNFKRLREGIVKFNVQGYDVYMMKCGGN